MVNISVVVPCYNEQDSITLFYQEIISVFEEIAAIDEFELIFVNDGSKDDTLKQCKELSGSDRRVQYISFSRNFGKEAAMYAGMKYASGDFVVIMDADLQHPPALIKEMIDYLSCNPDFDCVEARRVSRQGEPVIRSFFARKFYKLINKISDVEIVEGACDFRMMRRKMVNALLSLPEYNRFSKGLFAWWGLKRNGWNM